MTAGAQHEPVNVYSDGKAQRLLRTFLASMAFSFLVAWFDIVILRPAKEMEVEMRHMDPSEIISIPFPLKHVTIFTMVPVFVLLISWVVTKPSTVGWKILSFIKVTGLVLILIGLCGIDVIGTWQHSIAAALFLATLLCTNLTEKRTSKILEELPFYDHSDVLSSIRLYVTMAFITAFSILSILDHGGQNQRWPVPVFIGGTYGFTFGSIIGICLVYYQANRTGKEKQ